VSELLAPLGVYLATFLPYFTLSLVSADAIREAKVFPQAIGAAVVLLGLACTPSFSRREHLRVPRTLSIPVALALSFVFASAIAGAFHRTDPLALVPVAASAALFLAGMSRQGEATASRAFPLLMAAGAATGLLAFLQRRAGLFVLPFSGGEGRYRAAALIGNPGDVGAALVLPGLLLAAALVAPGASRWKRAAALAGLILVAAGLGATEALTPIAAVGVGLAAIAFFSPRRPTFVLAVVGGVTLLTLLLAGGSGRLEKLLTFVEKRDLARLTSERDIGFFAAVEMIRAHPILGVGPSGYSNTFVPARLRAETRLGRRLAHSSDSAHFENAHNEAMTFAAEEGLPAALSAAAAYAVLLVLLARRRQGHSFSILLAFAVLGLASFPSRMAVVAGPGAFVVGLAVRSVSKRAEKAEKAKNAEKADGTESRSRWPGAILFGASALLLLLLALARREATLRQAEGEAALQLAAQASAPERASLLDISRNRLQGSLSLRRRSPTAWLALGSALRLDRNPDGAEMALMTSLDLEERAETDLNLGRLAYERGRREEALAWFRRAVWILPRLAGSLPPDVDLAALEKDLVAAEAGLAHGGMPPPSPKAHRL